MVGEAGEHVGEIVLRIQTIELGALDQRIDRRRRRPPASAPANLAAAIIASIDHTP
jgi:hypothetical protein